MVPTGQDEHGGANDGHGQPFQDEEKKLQDGVVCEQADEKVQQRGKSMKRGNQCSSLAHKLQR